MPMLLKLPVGAPNSDSAVFIFKHPRLNSKPVA
jgi:hypothetical protein